MFNFKTAENKAPVFIINVHKDTKEQDIIEYVKNRTEEHIVLVKLSQKKDRGHNAFKLFVPRYKLHMFLDEKLLPKGILFRFINFKKNRGPSAEAMKSNKNSS